jgi:hypothetical protein
MGTAHHHAAHRQGAVAPLAGELARGPGPTHVAGIGQLIGRWAMAAADPLKLATDRPKPMVQDRESIAAQGRGFMRALTSIGAFVVAVAVAACGEEEVAIPFDPTTQNLFIRGSMSGFEFDIAGGEANEGEREYSLSRLCEVSAEFTAMVDGAPWSVDLELSNFENESFGVGHYAVIGDEVAGAAQTSFEVRLDGETVHYERSGIGGSIEVKVYDSTGSQAGSPGVLEGGSVGAVFDIDFGAGETIEGSFNVDLSTTTVEDEDC